MNIRSSSLLSLLVFTLLFQGSRVFAQPTTPSATPPTATPGDNDPTEIQEPATEPDQPETIVKETVVNDDELPSESVTPITDNNSNVLNKKIKFTKRFQVDAQTGSILDEPLINASYLLIRGSYYTTEEYSFGVGLRSRFGGKTTYSEQLFEGSARLQFERAPEPTSANFVSFGYSFYYGKISLGKNLVIPATTKLDTDFGMQSFGSTAKPFLQSAITQSFYLNTHIALGISIGMSIAQSIDSTSVNIRSTQPVPNESSFATKMQTNQYLSLNLSAVL